MRQRGSSSHDIPPIQTGWRPECLCETGRVIDPAFLRENPELVKRSQEARGHSSDTVDAALAADRERAMHYDFVKSYFEKPLTAENLRVMAALLDGEKSLL